jgi:toxin-antitoxin system PIN domain toxin
MRALLDVNVLIALLDVDNAGHQPAAKWLSANTAHGWASCPITENGCVRIMSQPGYVNSQPIAAVARALAAATAGKHHQFWPDDVSLLDPALVDVERVHGPLQITDAYLLALAVRHGGRLVTFDQGIALAAVRGAAKRHVVVL